MCALLPLFFCVVGHDLGVGLSARTPQATPDKSFLLYIEVKDKSKNRTS